MFSVFAANRQLYLLYLCYPLSWAATFIGLYIAYVKLHPRAVAENEARYRREHSST